MNQIEETDNYRDCLRNLSLNADSPEVRAIRENIMPTFNFTRGTDRAKVIGGLGSRSGRFAYQALSRKRALGVAIDSFVCAKWIVAGFFLTTSTKGIVWKRIPTRTIIKAILIA